MATDFFFKLRKQRLYILQNDRDFFHSKNINSNQIFEKWIQFMDGSVLMFFNTCNNLKNITRSEFLLSMFKIYSLFIQYNKKLNGNKTFTVLNFLYWPFFADIKRLWVSLMVFMYISIFLNCVQYDFFLENKWDKTK